MEFELRNARLVLPEEVRCSSLTVGDGVIQHIGKANGATSLDCDGDYVLPGLIEAHTDNLERHLRPRPGTDWNADHAVLAHDAELACAGITTAFDAVTIGGDLGDGLTQNAYLDEIAASVSAGVDGLLRVDHHLHLRCELSSPHLREYLGGALGHRVPRLLSLMDHTPGQGQWTNIEHFRQHYIARHGVSPDAIDALIARRQSARAQFSASNRSAALEIANRHDCVLASHDDTTDSDVDRAHRDACSISEFPTSLDAARAARQRGMHVICGAPNLVRGRSHSGNVSASSLVRQGLCDILSSDYYPASLLQATFMLSHSFNVPLPLAVAKVTDTPARVLRLADRGRIEEGKRADLIRVRETRRGPVVVSVWRAGRQVA
jgi:alpha-D-ribose 1-methylphosphonate 5-triphosphate diphosphatase